MGLPSGPRPALFNGANRVRARRACARRLTKLERVVQCEAALGSLRVCWENWGGAYNCGCCDKCVRTMTALTILGVLGRYTRFPDPVDPHELVATPARPESQSL